MRFGTIPSSGAIPAMGMPGTPHAAAAALHAEGWQTLRGLDETADPAVEARRLGCSHILRDGRPEPLG